MKKINVALVALLAISTLTHSQDMKPVMKGGIVSLNFTFGGLGSFGLGGSGISGGLGISYFLTDASALRFGVQARHNSATTPWTDRTTDLTNPGVEGSSTDLRLSLGLDHLTYMDGITARVKPFYGIGIKALYTRTYQKESVSLNALPGTLLETKHISSDDGLTLGLTGILGAEFFIYPEISLSAEYDLNIISMTTSADKETIVKEQPGVVTKRGTVTQVLGFGTGGATLHIYF